MSEATESSRCTLYVPGHTVHFIQAIHSAKEPRRPRSGRITAVGSGVLTAEFDGEVRRYRNHDTARIRTLVQQRGPEVDVDEGWSILRLPHPGGATCFSIALAGEPRRACLTDEQTRFDAEGLRQRMISHGGFLVPGRAVLGEDR